MVSKNRADGTTKNFHCGYLSYPATIHSPKGATVEVRIVPEDSPESGPTGPDEGAQNAPAGAETLPSGIGSTSDEEAAPATDRPAEKDEAKSVSEPTGSTSKEDVPPDASGKKKRKRRKRLTALERWQKKRQEKEKIDHEVRAAEAGYRRVMRKEDNARTYTLGGGLRALVAGGDEQAREVYIRIVDHNLRPHQVPYFEDWLPSHWRPEWPVPERVRRTRLEGERGSASGGQERAPD